jgi:DNA-binding GntR family transcriptional regulator
LTLTTGGRLRDEIEDEILTGMLSPGDRLEEASLAARFQVSRTPVREALHQLSIAGLIEIRPRRGAVVATLGPERLVEMFEVMAELEGMCGRLAARRLTPEARVELISAHEACGSARTDTDRYYYLNEHFHHVIYACAGNRFLAEQADLLHKRLKPYRRLQLRARNRVETSFKEHERIVAAIVAGDALAAERELRSHIVVQGERFSDLLASLPHR